MDYAFSLMTFFLNPFSATRRSMKLNKLIFGIATLVVACAASAIDLKPTPLPLEDGGLFALVAVCVAAGIYIVRKQRNK